MIGQNFSLRLTALGMVLAILMAQGAVHAADRKSIKARWSESPIEIDGLLEEPDWALAEPVSDFLQSEPHEGGAPTEKTEVRVLFDQDRLYIGVYLYDSSPDKILINDLQRDFQSREGDVFGVIIDAFHNQRTGFTFFTNPEGAKNDSEGLGDGRYTSLSWDGVWYTASRVLDDGWSCEIAIPFKTLRFDANENQVMGINFKRRIRRKNEDLYWSLVPRRYNSLRVSMAGDLLLERKISPGRNLQVKPFVTVNLEQMRSGSAESSEFDPQAGVDVKYSVTPGLTMDLTSRKELLPTEMISPNISSLRLTAMGMLLAIVMAQGAVHAADRKSIKARWSEGSIEIDGLLEEADWALAEPVSDFLQSEPHEGGAPTEKTEVRVLFDQDRLHPSSKTREAVYQTPSQERLV